MAATRRDRMAVLAAATRDELSRVWASWEPKPAVSDLRPAEIGLVMVRGRAGGDGAPFNLGEATVTRAAVALSGGTTGFGHVLGRDRERARLAAIFDALGQIDPDAVDIALAPVRVRIASARATAAARAAATRVDFFTMVRGE